MAGLGNQLQVIFSSDESSACLFAESAALVVQPRQQLDPDCFQLSSIGEPQQGISESGSLLKK